MTAKVYLVMFWGVCQCTCVTIVTGYVRRCAELFRKTSRADRIKEPHAGAIRFVVRSKQARSLLFSQTLNQDF